MSLSQTPIQRPDWQNLDGFPTTTLQLEQRQLNPFADINSYASRKGMFGARPLDCKGELGARPVQQWKEMLREGMQYRQSHSFRVPEFEPWQPGSQSVADPSNPLHRFLDAGTLAASRERLMRRTHSASPGGNVRRERRPGSSSSTPRGSDKGSARGKSTPRSRGNGTSTPRRRASSAGRNRALLDSSDRMRGPDGASPFLRSGGGGERRDSAEGGTLVVARGRSGSPAGSVVGSSDGTEGRPRMIRVDSGPFSHEGRTSTAVSLPPSALPPQKRTANPLATRDSQFSFWGGRAPGTVGGRTSPGRPGMGPTGTSPGRSGGAFGGSARPSSARTAAEGIPRTKPNTMDTALVLARARGRSPTRWGPAGERRLSIANRPAWRPVTGFPDTTLQTEHRKLNPFSDINSFASRQGYTGARPLDCKGENGARPVQQWKEMLRNGSN